MFPCFYIAHNECPHLTDTPINFGYPRNGGDFFILNMGSNNGAGLEVLFSFGKTTLVTQQP